VRTSGRPSLHRACPNDVPLQAGRFVLSCSRRTLERYEFAATAAGMAPDQATHTGHARRNGPEVPSSRVPHAANARLARPAS